MQVQSRGRPDHFALSRHSKDRRRQDGRSLSRYRHQARTRCFAEVPAGSVAAHVSKVYDLHFLRGPMNRSVWLLAFVLLASVVASAEDLATSVARMARIGRVTSPTFSPDGKRIAFVSDLNG